MVRTYHDVTRSQHSQAPGDAVRAPACAVPVLGEDERSAVRFWLQSQHDNEYYDEEADVEGENSVLYVWQNAIAPEIEAKSHQRYCPEDAAIMPWFGDKLWMGKRDQP